MKKKMIKKKVQNEFGLLPNCIVKKKKFVLQPWICIARGRLAVGERVTIEKLYCDKEQQVG